MQKVGRQLLEQSLCFAFLHSFQPIARGKTHGTAYADPIGKKVGRWEAGRLEGVVRYVK
jgi:hypothetical protein